MVTIVVLLILAGVSISLVLGENGIIAKAKDTEIAQAHAQVKDAIMLEYGDYQINLYASQNDIVKSEVKIAATTAVATSTTQQTFLEFLQGKNYIDDNGIVNVTNLLGISLNYGNGTGNSDVYRVEEIEGNYELRYYDKDEAITEIDVIGPIVSSLAENEGDKIEYTQADIDETLKYFIFDKETGILYNNPENPGEYYHNDNFPKKIVIPNEIDGVKVTDISGKKTSKYYVFGKSKVEEVVILAKIQSIDNEIFSDAKFLNEVMLPNSVTSIGSYAFSGCSSLASITIPNSVTSIEDSVFSNCSSLASITIPNSVTSIEGNAFANCSSLANITIPNSVTSIISWAFNGCSNLKNINVDSKNTAYSSENGVLFNKDKTKLIYMPRRKNRNNIYNTRWSNEH